MSDPLDIIKAIFEPEYLAEHKCPTCEGYIPNNDQVGEYSGAISRRDNKTEICSACGTREGMEDFFGSHFIIMKGN
jgi:RNA polymerase subunit RPABC4/transcription elongation factor Spt4